MSDDDDHLEALLDEEARLAVEHRAEQQRQMILGALRRAAASFDALGGRSLGSYFECVVSAMAAIDAAIEIVERDEPGSS